MGGDISNEPDPYVYIDYIIKFTVDDLCNLSKCLNTIIDHYDGNMSPEELEELVNHLREFISDQ
jgi:hypothetical protein